MVALKMKKTQEQTVSSVTDLRQSIAKTFSSRPKDTVKALDIEDKIELERKEAYIEPKTRDLLRKLLQAGDKEEIIPVYTPGLGFEYQVTYGSSSESGTDKLSRDCLEDLVRLDILHKSFFDSVSACPNCESTIITFHNRCPKCKSHNVDKTSLTEHIPCGYIDQKEKYEDNRCPKCGETLLEGQYRHMGRWYVCQECKERFENPEFDLVCRSCHKNFMIKDAKIRDIPKFSLNLVRKKEIRQNVASLETIRLLLTELGFNIEIPGLTIGLKSGMQHHFSLIAKKQVDGEEIVIALDHTVSESEVQTSPVILYIYKISEVKVDIPIFIAMPQLSETARKITQGNNILLIEGPTDDQETINSVKRQIEERISQKTPGKQTAKAAETKEKKSLFFKLKK
jgi:ssDNA-binding Zn-finger/Zn-ribbon topoisomerase 1